ncbi:nucleoside diphosphate-linked moiety X motif 8 isoform X2 [Esox lucius]|uniref:Nudix hydrolase domain-containing protein n=2 Tax=Esox lucius TaxID=8010 RepID=A0A3P8ZSA1_ESOLU|nr:nucleoside diphosphate-linked moiety X motif 8 isoform X2 [Esox lucius]
MLRSPQILALTCTARTHRPLPLSLRDPRMTALSEHTCQSWTGSRAVRRLLQDEGKQAASPSAISSPPVSRGFSCVLNTLPRNTFQKATPFNRPPMSQDCSFVTFQHPPRLSALVACNPWKTTFLEHFDISKSLVSSSDIKCLVQRRQSDNRSQCSLSAVKGNCTFSVKSHFKSLVRSCTVRRDLFYRLLVFTSKLCTVKPRQSLSRPTCLSLQSRRLHQAATPPLEGALWRCLSPENEARCRQSLGPNVALYEKDIQGKGGASKASGSWAAVLVALCSVDGESAFLFTLRSAELKGRHKGDVSFAGGKRDPSDKDVVDTALREACEELGVTVATEQVWGVLKPLRDMSGMVIAPVLANLGPLEALSFKPNPAEVDEIFTLTLSHVCSPRNRGYTHFRTGDRYGYTLPVFRNGKHRVWGLTAVALEHTLKLLVPP